MDTTKIKETQMTKTPEELTADWNAGKLEPGWYYVKFADEIYPDYYFNGYFIQTGDKCGIEVIAPVLTYDKYKAIQEVLLLYGKRSYAAGYGNFVRKNIDSDWGKDKEREITKKRKYEISLNVVAEVSTMTIVEAESEEDAEEIAKEKLKGNRSDWSIDTLSNVSVWDQFRYFLNIKELVLVQN